MPTTGNQSPQSQATQHLSASRSPRHNIDPTQHRHGITQGIRNKQTAHPPRDVGTLLLNTRIRTARDTDLVRALAPTANLHVHQDDDGVQVHGVEPGAACEPREARVHTAQGDARHAVEGTRLQSQCLGGIPALRGRHGESTTTMSNNLPGILVGFCDALEL